MKRMIGKFITVEGIEGVGKTTNLNFIRDYLLSEGKEVVVTREPGGTLLGENIRELLLGHKHDGMADDTELLMMFSARAEHLDKVIKPNIQAGRWVLCDRFTDATYAYQGGGRGIDLERIAQLEQWVQSDLRPDVTFLLDAPVELALDRAGKRSAPDRFEKEQHAFFERVRAVYHQLAKKQPQRYIVIDTSADLVTVQNNLLMRLKKYLKEDLKEDLSA